MCAMWTKQKAESRKQKSKRRSGAHFVEVGTPVTRCPPHRSRRAVLPHRALQVNSLSHSPAGVSLAAENPAAVDRNSIPAGKAFPAYSFPQCAVWALGIAPASD